MSTKLLHSEWQFKRYIAGKMPTCCVIGCSNSTRKTKKKIDLSTPLGKITSKLIFASDYHVLTFIWILVLSTIVTTYIFGHFFRIFDLNHTIMNCHWSAIIEFLIFTFCTNFEQLSRCVLESKLSLKCMHELK